MKKLLISATFALALITSAFAAPASSGAAKKHFSASFAGAQSVSWKTADTYEQVSFTLNNEKVEVFYDSYGEMVGVSKVMAFDKLPKSALESITTDYTFPEYQLKECIQFTNADNEINYYVSFDSKSGNVVLKINQFGAVSLMTK